MSTRYLESMIFVVLLCVCCVLGTHRQRDSPFGLGKFNI